MKDMDYSIDELAKMLVLNTDELAEIYITPEQARAEKEKKAALKEVNRILKGLNSGTTGAG
jgi:hypothetical protein